jgi:hypothetical protein
VSDVEPQRHVAGPPPRDDNADSGNSRLDRARGRFDRFRTGFTITMVFVVLPVFMIPALILFAPSVTGSWAATHGRGMHGTFTSYGQSCDDPGTSTFWPNSCSLDGIFTPVDGSFPIDATLKVPSATTQVSDRPAVAPGEHPVDGASVYIEGSRGWMESASLELTALGALVAWAVLLFRGWRRWRHRKRELASSAGAEDAGRHRRHSR